jgi:serine protease Do
MSDAYTNPPGNPNYPSQYPAHSHPSYPPYGPDPREGSGGGIRLSRALWLLVLLLLLWIVPSVVEQVRFAWARGKERAEAEVARQLLDDGRGPTIGQYRTVVKAVQPSVVGVKASRAVGGQDNDELSGFFFGPGRALREQDQGSGVIVDSAGFIITNYHVVDRATDVRVELNDGETHRATIVGTDPATDLAVLKIDSADLKAAPWGKSSDMEVGDPVLAIGSPFGLSRTVTAGILSAIGRHAVVEHVNYQDFLQTDAAVNPGNSGGPLVNMHGEIIGINTAIVGPTYQGISFAIPSDMVHDVYGQLVKSGKVARGWLGVSMRELSVQEAQQLGVSGAYVRGVVEGAPAAEAGIERGDVITKFNGKRVSGPAELGLAVAWSKIGEKATVTVRRGDETKEIKVDIGQRPEQLPQQ